MRCTRDTELFALMHVVMVIIGLRLMLSEMKLLKDGPTPVYVDNTAVLDGMVNKKTNRSQRYSEIRRGWIRGQVEDLLIKLLHCQSNELLPDSGTKAHTGVAKTKFRRLLLGLQAMDRSQFSSVARHAEIGSKFLNEDVREDVADAMFNYLEKERRRLTVDDTRQTSNNNTY